MFYPGQRVRLKFFPDVIGTVIGQADTPSPSVWVKLQKAVLDVAAGETTPIALIELEPSKCLDCGSNLYYAENGDLVDSDGNFHCPKNGHKV